MVYYYGHGLKDEFKNATNYLSGINFTNSNIDINFFEMVIRYLDGLLSAHELLGDFFAAPRCDFGVIFETNNGGLLITFFDEVTFKESLDH